MDGSGGARAGRDYWGIALAALGYLLTQELSFHFPDSERVLMAVWPAAGVGLASFLLLPRRRWPLLALALYAVGNLANLHEGRPLLLSLGFMGVNLLESWLSALLLLGLGRRRPRFDRLVEVGALALAAVAVNAGTALAAAGVAAVLAGSSPHSTWLTWWIADGLGILLVTPLILGWGGGEEKPRGPPLLLEYLLFFLLWLAFSRQLFYGYGPADPASGPLYILLLLILWPALRLSSASVGLATLFLAAMALMSRALIRGPSPLGGATALDRLLSLELFLGVLGLTGYAFGAAFAELRRALGLAEGRLAELQHAESGRRNSEERARAVLAGAADGIYLADARGIVQECNEACCRILGLPREAIEGRPLSELLGPLGPGGGSGGESLPGLRDTFLAGPDGSRRDLEIATRGLGSGELVGILRDVTARRFEERCAKLALRLMEGESETSLEEMIREVLAEAEASTGSNGSQFHLFTGEGRGSPPPLLSRRSLEAAKTAKGGPGGGELLPLRKRALEEMRELVDNLSRPREAVLPLVEAGRVRALFCLEGKARDYEGEDLDRMRRLGEIARQLVDRREARGLLEETEERFSLVFRHSPVPTLISRADTGFIVDANETFCSLFGYALTELVGRSAFDLDLYVSNEERLRLGELLVGDRRNLVFEPRLRKKDGSLLETRSSVESVYIRGAPYFVKQIEDVTERKLHLERLQKALAEKEILLRELYHRANNNMQVVSALLDFQALSLDQPEFTRAIEDTQNRIGALALVNRKLFEAQDLSYIDLRDYIEDLLAILAQSYAGRGKRLRVTKRLESLRVLVDTAMPCGLIINELVSNVYRHAYPDRAEGSLEVELRRLDEGRVSIRVADRGVGLAPGFDPERDGKIGLQNVLGLCSGQLRGRVKFERTGGLVCEVLFSDDIYKARV